MAGNNKFENNPNSARSGLKKMINARQRKIPNCREPIKDGFIYKQNLTFEWLKYDNMAIKNKFDTEYEFNSNNQENIKKLPFLTFSRNHFSTKESIDIQENLFFNLLETKNQTYQKNKHNQFDCNEIKTFSNIISDKHDSLKNDNWHNYDCNSQITNGSHPQTISTSQKINTKERLYSLTFFEFGKCQHFAQHEIQLYLNHCSIPCSPLLQFRKEKLRPQSFPPLKSCTKFNNKYKENIQNDDVFLLSPSECLLKFGIPLPPAIYKAILHLSLKAHSSEGIFRKSGRRMNIECLENSIRNSPLNVNLRDYSNYEIADVIKRYISNIEGTIFTSHYFYLFALLLSNDNLDQYYKIVSRKNNYINSFLDLAQLAILCLPDENRELLQIILEMLKSISNYSDINGMTIDNLAICLTPSLFQFGYDSSFCDKKNIKNNLPQFDLSNFQIPHSSAYSYYYSICNQLSITKLGCNDNNPNDNYMMYMCTALATLYEEYVAKFVSWKPFLTCNNIVISIKRAPDNFDLPIYRGSIYINTSPSNLLYHILYKMADWNPNAHRSTTIDILNRTTDLYYYRYLSGPFFRDFTLLRSWKYYESSELALIALTSVKMNESDIESSHINDNLKTLLKNCPNTHRFGIILASRYLIEKSENGSYLTYILRVDLRGRNKVYYQKQTPAMISQELIFLKNYFENKI